MEVTPTTVNGNLSGNATFNCSAMGGPQNIFSWTNTRSNTIVANRTELLLLDLMASDGGQYRCVVDNPAGRGQANVTLNGK